MGTEGNSEDPESEEMAERKRGSGQIPSGTNPRGAGRPTTEWLQFKREQAQFEEWKEAKNRGEFAGYAEIIGGLLRHGERDSGRHSEGDSKSLLERIAKIAGLEKVLGNINLDLIKGFSADVAPVVAPFVAPLIPYIAAPVGVFLGVTAWYMLEEAEKTDTYTREEWDALSYKVRRSYYIINGVDLRKEEIPQTEAEEAWDFALGFIPPIFKYVPSPMELAGTDEPEDYLDEEVEIVTATRRVAPQFLHGVVEFMNWFTDGTEKVAKVFGVDDLILYKMQTTFPEIIKKYFAWLKNIFNIFKKEGIAPPVTPGVHLEEDVEIDADYEEEEEHTFDIPEPTLDDKPEYTPPPETPPEETHEPYLPDEEEEEDPFVRTEEEEEDPFVRTEEEETIPETIPETTKDEETKEEEEDTSSTSTQEEEEEQEETYKPPDRRYI